MKFAKFLWITIALVSGLLVACGGEGETSTSETPEATPEPQPEPPRPLREVVGSHFEALPSQTTFDENKVLLGRALFHDRRLSGDESLSCSTCHMLTHGGAEPRATSTGIRGQVGPINSPTVLNASFNFRQFWDGRAADLVEQAAGPVTNPIEMGAEWPTVLERLRGDRDTVAKFTEVFGPDNPVTQEHVLDAIAAYEATLVTPSPFDRWLGGDDDALNEQQQRGLRLFVETGCTTCHRGQNIGGGMYQRMGLVHNYFERRGGPLTEADNGRFNATQNEEDRHKFKVPTLRNVALTSPYFHDGSAQELSDAVSTMAFVQLNVELEDAQVADIVAFLGALTGELPAHAQLPGATTEEGAEGAEGATPETGEPAPTEATNEG